MRLAEPNVFSQHWHVLSIICSATCRGQSVRRRPTRPSYLETCPIGRALPSLATSFPSASALRSETRFRSVGPFSLCSPAFLFDWSGNQVHLQSPVKSSDSRQKPRPDRSSSLFVRQETTRLEPVGLGNLEAGVFPPVSGRHLS